MEEKIVLSKVAERVLRFLSDKGTVKSEIILKELNINKGRIILRY